MSLLPQHWILIVSGIVILVVLYRKGYFDGFLPAKGTLKPKVVKAEGDILDALQAHIAAKEDALKRQDEIVAAARRLTELSAPAATGPSVSAPPPAATVAGS